MGLLRLRRNQDRMIVRVWSREKERIITMAVMYARAIEQSTMPRTMLR
jgi:hypothetical protein